MEEIEVKILEVNRTTLERKLAELGAKKVFDGNIQTFFFDFKEGTIINKKNVLRLRKEQDKIELTYKKVQVTPTAKTAQEYSVEVSSLDLGSFVYIPEFLEIEAKSTDLIYKYAKILGFNSKDCLPWSTEDLIHHYFKLKEKY